MEDEKIVALYWERNEEAIHETEMKYGAYLTKIAHNILNDMEDSRECVNDTYFKAWQAMPPDRPNRLLLYLGKITRDLSIDVYRKKTRIKRGQGEYARSLDEQGECLTGGNAVEEAVDSHLLADAIGTYLRGVKPEARITFIGRYYFADAVHEIAVYCGMSDSKVKSLLHRTRKGLKTYLKKEGFDI